MPQTRTTVTTLTKSCEVCPETLTIRDDQPITEAQAIALGSWLTVLAEIVSPEGMTVVDKHFCSTACLKVYIDGKEDEYRAAESRQLETFLAMPAKSDQPESFEQLRERLRSSSRAETDVEADQFDKDCTSKGND